MRTDVILFSTAKTTPSDVQIPTAVEPSYAYVCVIVSSHKYLYKKKWWVEPKVSWAESETRDIPLQMIPYHYSLV